MLALSARLLTLAWGLKGDKALSKLGPYVGKPNVYIRYINERFSGPNSNSAWSSASRLTPVGVYGFPLVPTFLPTEDGIASYGHPFVKGLGESRYVLVFSPRLPDKILNLAGYTDKQLRKDVASLESFFGMKIDYYLDQAKKDAGSRFDLLLVNLVKQLALPKSLTRKKRECDKRSLYEHLGYSGLWDSNAAMSNDIPQQVVLFRKRDVKPLLKMRNPLVA